MASSKEFEDIKLRTNEKSILNGLNNNGKIPKAQASLASLEKNSNLIRFLLNGKIKNSVMKTNMYYLFFFLKRS